MGNLISERSVIRLDFAITSAQGLTTPESKLALNIDAAYDSATSIYQTSDTITGGSDVIDLKGSLVDDLGDLVTFEKVHMVFFRNTSSSGANITFAPTFPMLAGTNEVVTLAPGAYNTYVDELGVQITAGTGDTITVTGNNGKTYDVIVVGLKP